MITWQKSSMKVSTDDPMITLKRFRKIRLTTTDDPTITFRFFRRNATDDPMITFGFFDERYRWSDDHIRFFWKTLPMIRWSHSVFTDDPTITFRFLPMIRWSSLTDDPMIIFTDDPMIIFTLFTDDPMIIKNLVLLKYYRWSDDQKKMFHESSIMIIGSSVKNVP